MSTPVIKKAMHMCWERGWQAVDATKSSGLVGPRPLAGVIDLLVRDEQKQLFAIRVVRAKTPGDVERDVAYAKDKIVSSGWQQSLRFTIWAFARRQRGRSRAWSLEDEVTL